ncbi:TonB-dependent receptor [Pseudomonas sp. Marseille-QA0332]
MSERCITRPVHPAARQAALHLAPTRTSLAVRMALLLGLGAAPGVVFSASTGQDSGPASLVLSETTIESTQDAAGDLPPEYAGGQVATGGRVGLLGNKDLLETPFSTISYTDKYIQDRQAKEITDVIAATDPSVFTNGVKGSHSESYSIRGFSTSPSDMTVDGLFGMAPFYRASPEMYERVEVLKGPSVLLNGMPPNGSVGGTVNLIPKRAGDTPLTRLTGTFESDSQFGGHLDVGRRFGDDNQFGVRFNSVYRDGDTSTNDQGHRTQLNALALDWRGERGRLSLDLFDSEDTINGQNRGIGLAAGVSVPKPPSSDTLLNPDWARLQTKDKGVILRGEYELSDQVMAYGAIGTSKTHYQYNGAMSATVLNDAGDFRTLMGQLQFEIHKTSAEVGLRGHFDTFGIGHQWSVNATQYSDKEKDWGRRSIDGAEVISNIYHPVWGPKAPTSWPLIIHTENDLKSYGLADTLSFLDDRVQLTLGVRRQEVVTDTYGVATGARNKPGYDEHATSPAAAILFRLTDNLSLYGNYIEGLSKGSSAPLTAANAGEVFAPYESKQREVGLKLDLGTFTHTLAFYEIKRPNSYTDPVTNIYSFGGEQRNRGVEWSFFGSPIMDVRLMGGIAYVDPKVTKGLPASEGKKATGTPKLQGKLGVEWDTPFVDGLTLTANATSLSKQYINADNSLSIPGYTIFDVGARYALEVGNKPVVLRANVSNLADKDYWGMPQTSSLALGAPRTYELSATVDF